MTKAAAGAAVGIPEHSAASQPVSTEAGGERSSHELIKNELFLHIRLPASPAAPNHTGVHAHTSFSDMVMP